MKEALGCDVCKAALSLNYPLDLVQTTGKSCTIYRLMQAYVRMRIGFLNGIYKASLTAEVIATISVDYIIWIIWSILSTHPNYDLNTWR
jgi:hypothetical protein